MFYSPAVDPHDTILINLSSVNGILIYILLLEFPPLSVFQCRLPSYFGARDRIRVPVHRATNTSRSTVANSGMTRNVDLIGLPMTTGMLYNTYPVVSKYSGY